MNSFQVSVSIRHRDVALISTAIAILSALMYMYIAKGFGTPTDDNAALDSIRSAGCSVSSISRYGYLSIISFLRRSPDEIVDIIYIDAIESDQKYILHNIGRLHGPREVRIYGLRPSDVHLNGYLKKQSVIALALPRSSINDPSFAKILQCFPSISRLDLSDCDLSALNILTLSSLPHLADIDLSATNITSDNLSAIAAIPSIRHISIANCHLHSEMIMSIQRQFPKVSITTTREGMGP